MTEINENVTVVVYVKGLKKTVKTLKKLRKALRKANSLVNELASQKLEITI